MADVQRGPRIDPAQFSMFAGDASQGGAIGFSWVECAAMLAFFGTVAFCGLQALWAPRKTFCSEHMRSD
jgi:hypothetical protein